MYCWTEGALVSAWLLLSPRSLFRGAESLLLLVRTGPQRHRSRAGDGSSIPRASQGCRGSAPPLGPLLGLFLPVTLVTFVCSSLSPSWEHPCPVPEGSQGGVSSALELLSIFQDFCLFGMPGLARFLSCGEENGKSESLLQKVRRMDY